MTTDQRMLFPEPAVSPKQSISERRQGAEWRTFSVDPQQGRGRLGLPFREYILLEEPRRRPLMLNFGCGIEINGGIWRRQPGPVLPHPPPTFLNHVALCNYSISASETRSGTKGLLTLLFFRAGGFHYLDGLLRQSIQSAKRVLDTLPSAQFLANFLERLL